MDSGGVLIREQAAYDVTYYHLDLTLDPTERTIHGVAAVHVTMVHPYDHLVLDLDPALSVERVEDLSGEVLTCERRGGRLWIRLGETQQPGTAVGVRISYGGTPRAARRAPWDGGFVWAEAGGQPWIATAVQGEGADLWWPCKDHPSDEPDSMRITVTVPQGLFVASNGRLRGREDFGGQTRFDWFVSAPINNYGVALNVAPYREIAGAFTSTAGDEVPVYLWVLPGYEEQGRWLFAEMQRQMAWFERTLGPYPWRTDKYGVVHTPHLGMEHQTVIAYGSDFDAGPDGFDWLLHHELAHEWWGNLVTAWDWRDFWIHEGFGTYMQALYAEDLQGEAGYRRQMQNARRHVRNAKPLAPRTPQSSDEMYFLGASQGAPNNDIYYKGAWVLHTLRFLVGEDVFRQSLRRFAYPAPEMQRATDGSQARFATTDDYVALVSRLAERDLAWFFEVYVRQSQLPRLIVRRGGTTLRLRWRVPGDLPFPMPVEISVDGRLRRVEVPEGGVEVPLPPGAEVQVDPRGRLLRAE